MRCDSFCLLKPFVWAYQEPATESSTVTRWIWTQNSSSSEFSVSQHIVQIKQYRGPPHQPRESEQTYVFRFLLSQLLRLASDMTTGLLRKYFFDAEKNNRQNCRQKTF